MSVERARANHHGRRFGSYRSVIQMHERIHECIDGERPRDELSAPERAQLAALEEAIRSVAARLLAGAVPDLSARIMARVAEIWAHHRHGGARPRADRGG